MTIRKPLFLITLSLLLAACRTSKVMYSDRETVHDTPVVTIYQHTVADPDTTAISEKSCEKETVRFNTNKAEVAEDGSWQRRMQECLDSMVNISLFETTQLGFCVFDATDNRMLFAVNPDQRLRPASNQKLVTAITALHVLGADHPFSTTIYTTGKVGVNGTLVGDIYIQGGMDPMLSKNDVNMLAKQLREQGISKIFGSMYVDLSKKDNNEWGWGWCWDDGEPLLTALSVDGKDTFSATWLSALRQQGISVSKNEVAKANTPNTARELAKTCHTLTQVLPRMMKQSDNTYAESVFYQLAFASGQPGAGRKEAVTRIDELIQTIADEYEIAFSPYTIADGSGVSLYNYLSPSLLIALLQHAYQNPDIYDNLYPTLPIAGVDGTLSKRMKGTSAENNVHAKTGTVSGIGSLSGYCKNQHGHTLIFCIINQGIPNSAVGRNYQDALCKILCEI